MSEMSVKTVGKVDPGTGVAHAYESRSPSVVDRPTVSATQGEQGTAAQSSSVQNGRAASSDKPKQQSSSSGVFLKFRVDEKTRDVTVFVIDRASKKVVRSIPPEELNTLQAGDLLELLA